MTQPARGYRRAVGELFTDYDGAWAHFLERAEPLESFYARLPDDPVATIDGWLIEVPAAIKTASRQLRDRLAHVESLRPVPDHFLHVWLGSARELSPARAEKAWAGIRPFGVQYRRVNCFHDAVIVEADAKGVRSLVAAGLPHISPETFLPHMTVAYTAARTPPEPVRQALAAFRESAFGEGLVREVRLCRVPIARSTFLEPWTAVAAVELR